MSETVLMRKLYIVICTSTSIIFFSLRKMKNYVRFNLAVVLYIRRFISMYISPVSFQTSGINVMFVYKVLR